MGSADGPTPPTRFDADALVVGGHGRHRARRPRRAHLARGTRPPARGPRRPRPAQRRWEGPSSRREVAGYLANRMGILDWRSTHPEVADGEVARPVVIVGQPRTGTTILYDLLAQDPANRAPLTWEVDRPVPPPETATYGTDPRIAEADAVAAMPDLLIPGFTDFHPLGATLAQECVRMTGGEFRSMIFPTQYDVPDYDRWLLHEADMAPAYRWHRIYLQHLQSRHAGDAVAAQVARPPVEPRGAPRRVPRRPGHPDPPGPGPGDLVDQRPGGAAAVHGERPRRRRPGRRPVRRGHPPRARTVGGRPAATARARRPGGRRAVRRVPGRSVRHHRYRLRRARAGVHPRRRGRHAGVPGHPPGRRRRGRQPVHASPTPASTPTSCASGPAGTRSTSTYPASRSCDGRPGHPRPVRHPQRAPTPGHPRPGPGPGRPRGQVRPAGHALGHRHARVRPRRHRPAHDRDGARPRAPGTRRRHRRGAPAGGSQPGRRRRLRRGRPGGTVRARCRRPRRGRRRGRPAPQPAAAAVLLAWFATGRGCSTPCCPN